MKTYVIGDVHGCYDEFMSLLEKINPDLKNDKLILLGDYIDRGPKSWEMVKELESMQQSYGEKQLVLLRGNHEQMALEYFLGQSKAFLYNGGHETLKSFTRHKDNLENHLDFFRNLPLCHTDEHFIYVHGGIKPGVSLSQQNASDLLWLREEFYEQPNATGKTVIFGHTPTLSINDSSRPIRIHNNIALDTGCVYHGSLSALEIQHGEILALHQTRRRKAS